MQLQRPLSDEPLPLDLVNTRWMEHGMERDLLSDPALAVDWLADHGVAADPAGALGPLRDAREAIRRALLAPEDAAELDALNRVLAHGHLRERVGPEGPQTVIELDDERWRLPWQAAHELVELLRARPERIKGCAGDGCVLWFLDTTRSATRRWCSMEACGNRMKVRRHRAHRAGAQG